MITKEGHFTIKRALRVAESEAMREHSVACAIYMAAKYCNRNKGLEAYEDSQKKSGHLYAYAI